ncbi:unnamed protein product [Paramecium octaurelia]|uniref:Uncharacterized protein n=1 Tax=Paramecium octaurelia TaxID=43137 RepID=A0A8S1XF43_PAROT|nr:unnamed protein product [Paramecium octaurelia]
MRQQFENKDYYTFIVLYKKIICMIRNSQLEIWEIPRSLIEKESQRWN